jgi:hypothetical protein
MRYAVSIPPFTDPSTILEMAIMAEQAGWDAVFVLDCADSGFPAISQLRDRGMWIQGKTPYSGFAARY